MRSMIFWLGLGLWLGLSYPALAGVYDGKWVADIPVQGRCNVSGMMTLVVVDHDVAGEVHRTTGNPNTTRIAGTVDDDGNGTFVAGNSPPGTMKFDPDHFDATWFNGYCNRHAQGDRAPNEQQTAALAAERKQHQARYADLVRRALADDKTLDYTELRRESVYAKHWSFYDGQAVGLLDQAAAAVKGKDCVAGLEKLDEVIKLDFIIDAAHALKADCLKQAGKPDQARIESDIADGLIHSLMDSAGGAKSLMRALNDGDGADRGQRLCRHHLPRGTGRPGQSPHPAEIPPDGNPRQQRALLRSPGRHFDPHQRRCRSGVQGPLLRHLRLHGRPPVGPGRCGRGDRVDSLRTGAGYGLSGSTGL